MQAKEGLGGGGECSVTGLSSPIGGNGEEKEIGVFLREERTGEGMERGSALANREDWHGVRAFCFQMATGPEQHSTYVSALVQMPQAHILNIYCGICILM